MFEGKSEVIQSGFDRGFQLGALHSIWKVLESNFANEFVNEVEEVEIEDESKIIEDIALMKKRMEKNLPMIKIASNLYNSSEDKSV